MQNYRKAQLMGASIAFTAFIMLIAVITSITGCTGKYIDIPELTEKPTAMTASCLDPGEIQPVRINEDTVLLKWNQAWSYCTSYDSVTIQWYGNCGNAGNGGWPLLAEQADSVYCVFPYGAQLYAKIYIYAGGSLEIGYTSAIHVKPSRLTGGLECLEVLSNSAIPTQPPVLTPWLEWTTEGCTAYAPYGCSWLVLNEQGFIIASGNLSGTFDWPNSWQLPGYTAVFYLINSDGSYQYYEKSY